MQLSTFDVLDAYRADLASAGTEQFADSDAAWLAFGTMLQRATGLQENDRAEYLQNGAAAIAGMTAGDSAAPSLMVLARDGSSAAVCAAAMAVANSAEDAGAFALATTILDCARAIIGAVDERSHGRLLAHQARILRKTGELDLSLNLYEQVADLGATYGDVELDARAHLGIGVIARIRGNYPMARQHFLAILDGDASTDALYELHTHAHHGLMVASGVARDFETCLRHGSLALDRARDAEHRTELLTNLAGICLHVGQFRAALNSFLIILAESHLPRVRLAAFGSAAIAAARLGDAQMVTRLVTAALSASGGRGHEFEYADALREFAEAYLVLGNLAESQKHSQDALRRASDGGYFEITHRLETMSQGISAPAPIALTRESLDVATHLAVGDSQELLATAISSGHSDWSNP